MLDQYQRTIDYMRISVTDRCNLRCTYCMPQQPAFLHHNDILTYEEIIYFVEIMVTLGIENIKITGGEPLVRKNLLYLIHTLKGLAGVKHVTLTTNGLLLSPYIQSLQRAGIDGINISLDTIDPIHYKEITGQDVFKQVWNAIQMVLSTDIKLKINSVLCFDIPETIKIAALAEKYPLDIRFIEQMPIGNKNTLPLSTVSVLEVLRQRWPDLTEDNLKRGFGPARYYTSAALLGSIGFIDAISHNFCHQCNRVRLTSDGQLQLCLYHNQALNIKEMIRENKSPSYIKEQVRQAILQKPKQHMLEKEPSKGKNMYQIGG